ncbi:MAG: gliding motility-associated C-terminal domain-containing protein [Bacteroidia bacterium]|nr:gliding motility-associated C-terminal domain-containing protein [Bacteroidia bacterium]
MRLKHYIYLLFCALYFCFASETFAQGTLNFPRTECFKNVTQFSYTPASGLSLSSATWNFGDGSSSNSNTPQYIYKKTGTYWVKISANLSNGSSITDSASITIVPLPIANFDLLSTSDTCINNNNICLRETSVPGQNGQTIVNRLAVWGDGKFDNQANPNNGQSYCHRYSQVDKYLIKIEVTDKYGCKATKSRFITILEQTDAKFSVSNPFKDCDTKLICIKNQSTGKNKAFAKYYWDLSKYPQDTNRHFSSQKCFEYKGSQNGTIKLNVIDANGCVDSTKYNFSFTIDPLPKKLELSDSVACYSQKNQIKAFINPNIYTYDNMIWLLDGVNIGATPNSPLSFTPKTLAILPGLHTITCQIIRGTCTTSLSRKLTIHGPIAQFKVYEDNQCFTNRKVSFVDSSLYLNRKTAQYFWTIYDDSAPRCTTDRVNNQNVGSNCIYSTDYFHSHYFKSQSTTYKISFKVKDPATGCTDSLTRIISVRECSPLLSIDTFNLCQGEIFGDINAKLNPKFVSLDSGKTWNKFPIRPDKKLHGLIDVGFIFETVLPEWVQHYNDDSIKIRKDTLKLYDTIWKKPYLNIHSINQDSVTFIKYGRCNPFRATVKFADGKFYAGQTLSIDWGNGISDLIYFDKDSTLDSLHYVFKSTSVSSIIKLKVSNEYGCNREASTIFKAGKIISIQNQVEYYCSPEVVCLKLKITDFYHNINWGASDLNKYVKIEFPDTNGLAPGDQSCHFFKSPGTNIYRIFVTDEFNCNDTIIDSVFVQNLRANIKYNSRFIYCNELKQLFDSTNFIKYPGESITYYNWDFGSGTFTNPVINPFKSITTSADEINVVHVVKTKLGCVDTLIYKLTVIGSKPYFIIPDTIACNSLEAIFKNLSYNCAGYIWEFGDENQTILPEFSKKDVSFKYLKPGRYQIKLNGYDSIYNPATNSKYFCNTVFPDPDFQKDSIRAVVVLPQGNTAIISQDTVCVDAQVEFISKSDPFYDLDSWLFTYNNYIKPPGDTVIYSWPQIGKYDIYLFPKFLNSRYDLLCDDSAKKTIVVVDVNADFKLDQNSKLPLVQFINTTNPINSNMLWQFDTSVFTPDNFSNEIHPSHNYGYSLGEFTACLIASSRFGCQDTTCKKVSNDQFIDFMIFNVFTPGNLDGKNDAYDIIIKGEETYHLRIYDRWGVLVYESEEDGDDSNNVNWNGRLFNEGPECPPGTYYYIFDYTLLADPGKQETINGTVTLIR